MAAVILHVRRVHVLQDGEIQAEDQCVTIRRGLHER